MIWTIIIIAVVVVFIKLYKYGVKLQEEEDAKKAMNNQSAQTKFQNNDRNVGGQNFGSNFYKTLTKRDYDESLDPYPEIPLKRNYSEVNSTDELIKVLIKFMYGDIYLAFLKGSQFNIPANLIERYINALGIDIMSFNLKNFQNDNNFFAMQFSDNPSNIHPLLMDSFRNTIDYFLNEGCQKTLNIRVNSLNPLYVYKYSVGQVTPKSEMEKLELDIYISNYPENIKDSEKDLYSNDDMVRIKQALAMIPPKINEINNFNNQLQDTINEYEEKAIKTIEVSYASALTNSNFSRDKYFKSFDRISSRYSAELNPVVATACETSVKKVADFIKQKQDIIDKNNADIAKYNQLIQKLQKQYDDEFALQKIKEINKDVNSQMDDISDIAQKEEKNFEFQNIMNDIDQLDKEVNARRDLEIQFGQIEI